MDQRYQIQNLTGAITLTFPGPKIKARAGLIKRSQKIFRCYDSLKKKFQMKNIAHWFFVNKIPHQKKL